jgi:pimeloyl-ACP methyl ester carboxylesterase
VTTFVLVHGSWHGAWCWQRVIPELTRLGHRASAVELPSDQVTATTADLAAAISARISEPEDTVLVAHSMSGLVAPVVASALPLRELVFLAGLLPLPGSSWLDQVRTVPTMAPEWGTYFPRQRRDAEGRTFWTARDAAELFYHDCPPEDAAAAVARLRPQGTKATAETTPLRAFPDVPSRYLVCRQDRTVSGDWAAPTAVERFGAAVEYLDSSHSPFWSRPTELAAVLAG